MNTLSDISLNQNEKRVVYALQLLGDSTRFKIFKLLSGTEELCVSEIANRLDISPSAVSQHFRNFEMIGLVSKERIGQKICYTLNDSDSLVKELRIITKQ
jgi:ArsR family transcriptional regulator